MRDVVAELKSLQLHGMAQLPEVWLRPSPPASSARRPVVPSSSRPRSPTARCAPSATRWAPPSSRCIAIWPASTSARPRSIEALIAACTAAHSPSAAHNVVFIGGTGTGKTHLATAIGVEAIASPRQARALLLHRRTGQCAGAGEGARQSRPPRPPPDVRRPGDPRRAGLPAVQPGRRRACSSTCSPSSTSAPA